MTPLVSVVVLNWNGRHFLETCLSSLLRQTYPNYEIWLVDNGSEDGSVEYVQTHFPTVQVLALGHNTGFSAGNNAGMRAARGEYIALLNNDTEVDPRWIEAQVSALEDNRRAGSVASKLVFFDDRRVLDTAGNFFSIVGKGEKIGHGEIADERFGQRREVFAFCAGACLLRRSMLDEIGLFDEDFSPANYEDIDLAFRAQLYGYRCVYEPEAVVYHRVSATLGARNEKMYYLGNRNLEYVYFKNMPAPLLWKYGLLHLAYELVGLAYDSYHGYGRAVLRAKRDAWLNAPRLLQKRRELQRARRISAREVEELLDRSWHVGHLARTGLTEWQRARRWVGRRLSARPAG